jgi:leader peptidase (prepilin peptidase)/N-methyltransferase
MRYHFGDVDALADGPTLLAALAASPLGLLLAFVFGATWGSFYNVVVARLPRGQSVVRPGSHCFACGAPVKARDNIPLVSYWLLRGRCRACGVRFSPRYFFVELLTALLSVALWQVFVRGAEPGAMTSGVFDGTQAGTWIHSCWSLDPGAYAGGGPGPGGAIPVGLRFARYAYFFAFVSCLEVLALIDAETQRLPDVLTLPGIPLFFLAAFAADTVPWAGTWKERAIGLVAGYLVLRLISDFYYYVLKREGLGLGDAKLLALIGGALGWKSLPFVLFGGACFGTVIAIPLLLAQRARKPAESKPTSDKPEATPEADARFGRLAVPFGPFLAMAAVLWIFVGPAVLPVFGF